MTLRTWLLLAAGVLLVVLGLGAGALLESQRSCLVDQVDDEMRAATPLVRFPPRGRVDPPVDPRGPGEEPISRLFIGHVDDGELVAEPIVEAHHGTITLETTPGAGCRFVVTLPRHDARAEPAWPTTTPDP